MVPWLPRKYQIIETELSAEGKAMLWKDCKRLEELHLVILLRKAYRVRYAE